MNMMLGFGSTEQDFERLEEEALWTFVSEKYKEDRPLYFTEEFNKAVRKWLDERAKTYKEAAEQYRTATEYPDRYSSYYPYVLDDASYLVAIVKFHHINRRHGLSPDGWGLMVTERVFKIAHTDLL